MARSEARLAVTIWSDDDFLALTFSAQRMFMFLISQPDLAHDGVIALRERRWSKKAANLTTAMVADALDELQKARFIVVDEDAEELLVRSFIRRDKVYRQPNVLRAAADHLKGITSTLIRAELAAELHRIAAGDDIPAPSVGILAEMRANVRVSAGDEGSGKGSNTPSAKGIGGTPGERGMVTTGTTDSPFPDPRASGPRPRPSAGGRAGVRADASAPERETRPPDKCPDHIDDPDPPNCGRCAGARKARTRWDLADAERRRNAPKCRDHRGQPADNCALCRSEALAAQEAP